MDISVTNVVFIIGGVIGLAAAIFIYVYFNGGIQTNFNLLLGVLP